ncbi:uroporphyrinogen-III synthase [Ktedonospora formicarum]|uniref:Tetrapyrrole biosynthesis uroporphyrinogen III synthase domain-containing protein n=1 Tax=Ktedonospora formicarum TaxID=2778364 RepID=A0A8J3ID61_9CHLR|nr:uroporphyrinogen-III synthase [Ktedonospora formicarum]GHO50073.1 hypothetical protein KSX_82360 [Ktedonospora formicarum]
MPDTQTSPGVLQGKRILVTRTREQASTFSQRLRALGAFPLEFPTIRIEPPQDWSALDTALLRLAGSETFYDWLILTSVNGVNICMRRLRDLGIEPASLRTRQPALRIATIGPATAESLCEYGLSSDLVPDEYIAEGVITALLAFVHQQGHNIASQHILLARAAEARKVLVTELEGAGAHVDEVAAYYTLPVARDDVQGRVVLRQLQQGEIDILTFTSSSTVRNFVHWLRQCVPDENIQAILGQTKIASIGPITSQTAHDLGLQVAIEAREYTIDGLLAAIASA